MRTKYRQPSGRKRVPAAITALPMCLGSDVTLVGRQLGAASMKMGRATSWRRWPHHVTLSSVAEENVLHVRARSLQRPPLGLSCHTTSPPWSAADKNIAPATCSQRRKALLWVAAPTIPYTQTHTCTDAQANITLMRARARTRPHVRTHARAPTQTPTQRKHA